MNLVHSYGEENASSKIVNFMAPESGVLVLGWGSNGYIVKMHIFFKSLLRCSSVFSQYSKYMYIVMMKKNVSSEIVIFIAPESGVLVLGQGSNDYIVKMH